MKELVSFHDEIVNIYGYMVQVGAAFGVWNRELRRHVENRQTQTSLDSMIYFGKGSPDRPNATYQFEKSIGSLLELSDVRGAYSVINRRYVVVLLVALWENPYRKGIANECSIKMDDLKSDVLHDLNRYRQAIVHKKAILHNETRVINIFSKGDELNLEEDHMEVIFRMLIDELNRIGVAYYGKNPEFKFDKTLGVP